MIQIGGQDREAGIIQVALHACGGSIGVAGEEAGGHGFRFQGSTNGFGENLFCLARSQIQGRSGGGRRSWLARNNRGRLRNEGVWNVSGAWGCIEKANGHVVEKIPEAGTAG